MKRERLVPCYNWTDSVPVNRLSWTPGELRALTDINEGMMRSARETQELPALRFNPRGHSATGTRAGFKLLITGVSIIFNIYNYNLLFVFVFLCLFINLNNFFYLPYITFTRFFFFLNLSYSVQIYSLFNRDLLYLHFTNKNNNLLFFFFFTFIFN